MDKHWMLGLSVLSFVFLGCLHFWIRNVDFQTRFKVYDQQPAKSKMYQYHPSGVAPSITKPMTFLHVLDTVDNRTTSGNQQPNMRRKRTINILIFKKGPSMIGRKPGVYPCRELGFNLRLSYSDKPRALKDKHIVLLYLRTRWDWQELLKERPRNQIWILYSRESPRHDHGIMPPSDLERQTYNWTMTYRSDSTIQANYGFYTPGEPEISKNDTRNWAENKTHLVAWMASNCDFTEWRRTQFVKALSRKYIGVDMYGKCGTLKCPKKEKEECRGILSRYKFYLALENSLCEEYITEKFWRNALAYGSVPIVLGAPKEDYERLAPPNSFIHLSDFKSPEQFRDYLLKVNSNDTLYNTYFEWKKQGRMETRGIGQIFLPGRLCEMARRYLETEQKSQSDEPRYQLPELRQWWKGSCAKFKRHPVVDPVLGRKPKLQ